MAESEALERWNRLLHIQDVLEKVADDLYDGLDEGREVTARDYNFVLELLKRMQNSNYTPKDCGNEKSDNIIRLAEIFGDSFRRHFGFPYPRIGNLVGQSEVMPRILLALDEPYRATVADKKAASYLITRISHDVESLAESECPDEL
jgi:hypothetical protein